MPYFFFGCASEPDCGFFGNADIAWTSLGVQIQCCLEIQFGISQEFFHFWFGIVGYPYRYYEIFRVLVSLGRYAI